MTPLTKSLSAVSCLSVRPEGEGADVRLLFTNQPTGRARVLSGTVVHLAAAALLLGASQLIPDRVYNAILPRQLPDTLVWLSESGRAGGGGGGNTSPEPPPAAQMQGRDQMTVPAAPPTEPQVTEPENVTDMPVEPPAIPVQALAAATQVTAGDIGATATGRNDSRGIGDGAESGLGDGPGGPGSGRAGIGGPGAFGAGSGALPPRLRHKVDPQYSADAMHAKIQGTVLLSVVVLPDGSVTDIRVIRSLDRSFGLDQKAIDAARQWQFFPATRQGQPVPYLVNLELEFNLR